MTNTRPIRAAVIGAGTASEQLHMPVLSRLRDKGVLTLALVCDLREDRAARARRKFGFLADSGDAVAATARDDIDAVYVFGSAQMHYEYGLRALENGKHIFVEKPIAPSFDRARALADAARARGLVAVGGHNRRFYNSLEAVRARGGKAGWSHAEAISHKPESGRPPPFGARSWLGANGIHALDALVFMMGGLPETVTALTGTTATHGPFSAVMRWKNGAQGVFLCNNNAGARCEEYAFHAPGETCRICDESLVVQAGGKVSKTSRPMIRDGFAAEHEAFLDAIRSGIAPRHTIAALAPSLFLAERIEEGFSGTLELPSEKPVARAGRASESVLIENAGPLQASLTRLLPGYRLLSRADVRDASGPCDGVRAAILGHGASPLPPHLLNKMPNLGIVGVMGLSLRRYDPEALLQRGIALVNASGAYAETVAEFAFALAVLGRRRAFASHDVLRRGGWGTVMPQAGVRGITRQCARRLRPVIRIAGLEAVMLRAWQRAGPSTGLPGTDAGARELAGARVGLIGWGENARAFALRLVRAGAHVLVYSEHARANDVGEAALAPLSEVLAADIVSLHRGLTAATRHFLGAAELARLKPGAVLINVARGALIEPDALLSRLGRGDIFACLDSYEEEPLAPAHPLRRLPNVFLTSHIAGGSPEMHSAAAEEVVRKVAAWLSGSTSVAISQARFETMT